MSSKEVALETARYLDSAAARSLDGPRKDGLRRIAEAFFEACYEGVGKKPRLLEDTDLIEIAERHLPAAFGPGHDLLDHVPRVLGSLIEHLDEDQVVPHAFELRRVLDEAASRFEVASRQPREALRRNTAPVVHKASKLGRNDPCFCGSGKKFKKCCGKDA